MAYDWAEPRLAYCDDCGAYTMCNVFIAGDVDGANYRDVMFKCGPCSKQMEALCFVSSERPIPSKSNASTLPSTQGRDSERRPLPLLQKIRFCLTLIRACIARLFEGMP